MTVEAAAAATAVNGLVMLGVALGCAANVDAVGKYPENNLVPAGLGASEPESLAPNKLPVDA